MSQGIRRGFTLIELLVVIAIIAILSVVVILTLNPAELLRQARDSNRVSDLATMKSAISLYLVDVANVNLASTTNGGYANIYYSANNVTTSMATASSGISTIAGANATTTNAVAVTRAINATGWIPVNFSLISSGSPIGSLSVDPVNSSSTYDNFGDSLVYGYAATTTNYGFELTAHMESNKYRTGGTSDRETSDGGSSTSTYEQGSNPLL